MSQENNVVQAEVGKLIDICHSNIKSSEECMRYLQEDRGLSLDTISKFKIGYFPQNISRLTDFVSDTILQKLNIINYSGSSKFSEFFYLVFPIFSEYGEPVGIGGRTLLDDGQRAVFNLPKYKNSSFKKANVLYGLDRSRSDIFRQQNAYVVEGYFDHIALDSNGIKNSVAICGTAFSKNHILRLSRYTDKLTFILDRDDGGRKSMERIYSKYCNQGIKLRFMLLPKSCKDVDDYFRQGGDSDSFIKDLETFIPNW
jgi:DNA primase